MSDGLQELEALDAGGPDKPTLGPVRVDIAAYAAVVVTTVFAYLAWVAGVVAPADVISGTVAVVSGAAGFIWPNEGP